MFQVNRPCPAIAAEGRRRDHLISKSPLARTGKDLELRFEKKRDEHINNIAGMKNRAPSRAAHD